MDEKTFVYWLQGFVELADTSTISAAQWKMIKEHLALVFKKVTPPLGLPPVTPLPGLPSWPATPNLPIHTPQYQPVPRWEPRITCSLGGDNLRSAAIC